MLIIQTNITRCTFVILDYKITNAETINLLFLQFIEILRIKRLKSKNWGEIIKTFEDSTKTVQTLESTW